MEGYWLTHYETGKTRGDGIAMVHAGELFGGDFEHIWSGTYEEEDSKLYARIRIVPAVSRVEEEIMAREKPMILSLSGYFTEDFARLEGSPEGQKDLRFQITMRKCKTLHIERPLGKEAA